MCFLEAVLRLAVLLPRMLHQDWSLPFSISAISHERAMSSLHSVAEEQKTSSLPSGMLPLSLIPSYAAHRVALI